MSRKSDSGESQCLPNLSPVEVGKLCIKLYFSFLLDLLAEGCINFLFKEALKGEAFSSSLFSPLCLISYRVLIIGGNLLDRVRALGIFVQGTGNKITTSFHINTKLSPKRQQPVPTSVWTGGPRREHAGFRCKLRRVLRWVRKLS